MAIDTTQAEEFEYPGEEDVGDRPPVTAVMAPLALAAAPHPVGRWSGPSVGYLFGHWLGNVIASGYHASVQDSGQNDVAIVLGLVFGVVGWMAGIGGLTYPLAKILGRRALAAAARAELGALLPDDRRPQGRGLPVRRRRAPLPLHRRAARHAHPHRAAEPDQPRLRAGHLHRHRRASTARS